MKNVPPEADLKVKAGEEMNRRNTLRYFEDYGPSPTTTCPDEDGGLGKPGTRPQGGVCVTL